MKKTRSQIAKESRQQGQAGEDLLELIHDGYKQAFTAKIEKVDPPVKVVRSGPKVVRAIMLENPFPDYLGTWTERDGLTLAWELKHYSKALLPLGQKKAGVTADQLDLLDRWHASGAVTGVLWLRDRELRLATFDSILAVLETGRKSLKWDDQVKVRRGQGKVVFDWLAEL